MKHETIGHVAVSRETTARLVLFEAEVRRWAGTINLVARTDLAHLHTRHVIDSLQLLPLLAGCTGGAFVDVGTGGGFPGLVLAIATGQVFHLVEADQRKAEFLRHAARVCGARVLVHCDRIESLKLPPVRLATARAVAPLLRLLEWIHPKLSTQGQCVFMKGRTAATELALARQHWQMDVTCWASQTDPAASILQISDLSPRG